jgi:hypothetical protein
MGAGRWSGGGTAALALGVMVTAACAVAPRADAFVYWANHGGTTIGRANNDGTGIDQGFITGAREPCGLAVDSKHIYWGNQAPSTIGRADLDGTGVDQNFVTGVGGVCGIAVDATGIWWNNRGSPGGNVGRADLDGTDVDPDLFSSPQVQGPCGVALGPGNAPGRFLYWANTASSPTTIGRSPVPDPLPVGNFIPQALPSPCWPAVSSSHIYWTNLFSGIVRTDLNGGNPESVVGSLAFGGLAVSGARLYWANLTEGTISRSNLDGTSPDFAYIRGGNEVRGLAVNAGSSPPAPPCGELEFGKLKKNRKKGTAKLTVEVGCAGTLVLGGRGVKPTEREAAGAGELKLPVRAKGAKKKKLRKKGKAKVNAEITFTPTGGTPDGDSKKLKLVKRKK